MIIIPFEKLASNSIVWTPKHKLSLVKLEILIELLELQMDDQTIHKYLKIDLKLVMTI